MKINLLPLSLLGQLVSKVTCLGTIQRAYKTLYASCERLAIVIGDAAEVVPTNYEKRSWMQNQLRYKISGASSDLNDALEMLLCHDGLRNGKEDTTEMVDWQARPLADRKRVRARIYALARQIDATAKALDNFRQATVDDDGQPDHILSGWGFCGRPWPSFPRNEKFVIGE